MSVEVRDVFALAPGQHYLNCAGRAPLPRAAHAAARSVLVHQARMDRTASGDRHFDLSERVRARAATLVGASLERVAFMPAVSYGVAIAARQLPLGPTHEVLAPEDEFPSAVYAFMAACKRAGASFSSVPRPRTGDGAFVRDGRARLWSEALCERIGPRTAAVIVSTVHWTDGTRFDVERIAGCCRDAGALLVVDATQSLGAIPFEFDAVAPDLLLCSDYKWLLGPYQLGIAVFGDRLLEAEPNEHHWSGRKGSEDASSAAYRYELRDGARRFDVGAHADELKLSMLDASLELVLGWGPERVGRHCREWFAPLEHHLEAGPCWALAESERAPQILGIEALDEALLTGIMERAGAASVHVSRRGHCVRISPYLYNDASDREALLEILP